MGPENQPETRPASQASLPEASSVQRPPSQASAPGSDNLDAGEGLLCKITELQQKSEVPKNSQEEAIASSEVETTTSVPATVLSSNTLSKSSVAGSSQIVLPKMAASQPVILQQALGGG